MGRVDDLPAPDNQNGRNLSIPLKTHINVVRRAWLTETLQLGTDKGYDG
jgi:hypothetical protein